MIGVGELMRLREGSVGLEIAGRCGVRDYRIEQRGEIVGVMLRGEDLGAQVERSDGGGRANGSGRGLIDQGCELRTRREVE